MMEHPWTRREDETDQAWEGFVTYRDMGTARSLAKVAREVGKSTPLMERWSRKHSWADRSAAYDRHMDAVQVESYKRQTHKIVRQQTELADKLLRKLDANLDLLSPGMDPSIRWTNAFAAATKVQGGAMDMVKDKSDQTTDTVKAIERIIERLTQDPESDSE
jgi:hypothetical protein